LIHAQEDSKAPSLDM